MARVSLAKNLTIGILRSGRLTLGHGPNLVRCLSDKSDKSFDQVQSNLRRAEKEKPLAQTDHRLVWPDARGSEFKESTTHDTFPATWDFKNNELDVEQLAGLPGPREADDPYSSAENEQENWEHEEFLEELQFGRMLALRGQLNRELGSAESERRSLDAVRQSVDFMMQELSQISFMLRFLHPQENDANSMSQGDCALENVYSEPLMGSWVYTHPGASPKNAYADVSNVEEVVQEFQQNQESPVTTSEGEGQLSSDQETEALDEVIAADDAHKSTPTKPPQSTPNTNPNPNPNPSKDGRQVPQPQETIHTYKPFRTIEVPAPKPSQSLSTEANAEQVPVQDETAVEERAENCPQKEGLPVQDETAVEERAENSLKKEGLPVQDETAIEKRAENSSKKEGFTFSTQLSEFESRILMHMALKQALSDLESGKTNYKATVLLTDDVESHDVD